MRILNIRVQVVLLSSGPDLVVITMAPNATLISLFLKHYGSNVGYSFPRNNDYILLLRVMFCIATVYKPKMANTIKNVFNFS